jgi:hypothetical protein
MVPKSCTSVSKLISGAFGLLAFSCADARKVVANKTESVRIIFFIVIGLPTF